MKPNKGEKHECKEDMHGNCYECGKTMLQDEAMGWDSKTWREFLQEHSLEDAVHEIMIQCEEHHAGGFEHGTKALKSILLQERQDLKKKLDGMSKKLPQRLDCLDCQMLMKKLDVDDATCAICNGERGYNQALQEVIDLLSRI